MTATAAGGTPLSIFRQYNALTKPRVIQLIVFCALIGMVLAVPGLPSWAQVQTMALASLGVWLVAGAAAAFNCLVEKQIDARMRRTAWRPTARGELADWQALAFSAALCTTGSALLYFWVNPLTMWLTFATFVGYAVIYTVILKPLTPQNIVIGGASGAMPPVLGWAAMRGDVGPEAMLAACLLPFAYGMSGWLYLAAALVLNAGFIGYAIALWRNYSDALARKTFRFSLIHLSALFAALLLDHYL